MALDFSDNTRTYGNVKPHSHQINKRLFLCVTLLFCVNPL